MSDLQEALNGEVPSEPVEQQIEQPNEAETVQANTDDSTETEPTGEEVAETPAANVEPDPIEGLKAGISAERHKRQEAEQRARQLEAYIRQNQEKPDFWENPEGMMNDYARGMQAQMQQMQTNLSVEMMKTVHDDYDQMEAKFVEYAQANPALIAEMNQSGNPAKFAYDYAKTQTQIAGMKDPNYRENLKAELRAEIEAENKAKIDAEIQRRSQLPGTLSNERAAGGNTGAAYAPTSLESVLK